MLRHEFTQFSSALSDPQAPLPAGVAAPRGAVLAERFAVYRNNVAASLIDVLVGRFPVTLAIVGNEFFRAMARDFAQQSRPRSDVLYEYGVDFPEFIAGFAPAGSLPWLADLARLELLWTQSWGAADAPTIGLDSLKGTAPAVLLAARVVVHPAARLLRSSAPVASLWQVHQLADPDLSAIPWQAQDVLVTRPNAEVRLTKLSPDVARFAMALVVGKSIEAAACEAMLETADFAIGPALAGLLNCGFAMELKYTCA